MSTPGPRRSEIVAVYATGVFQGLSLVAVPAATIRTSEDGYDLSASQYGLLFLPQVNLAITGSLALPSLARRIGLKRVLNVGLVADTVAMTLLVVSNSVRDDDTASPMLLVATGCLGLGFGLTLGSISTYAGAFQPQRREVALTALNVSLGLGYGALAVARRRCPRLLRSGRDDVRELGHLLVDDGVVATSATYALAALFAFAGLACSGFFPMTIGYGESSFRITALLAVVMGILALPITSGLRITQSGR